MATNLDILEQGSKRLLNKPEIQASDMISNVIQGAIDNIREQEAAGVPEDQILMEMLPQLDSIIEGLEELEGLPEEDMTARDVAVENLNNFRMAATSQIGQ